MNLTNFLSEMLREALLVGENVDYREVQFILGRLSTLRKPELIPTVLENLERLYPVAESVAAFFKEFTDLPKSDAAEIGKALLNPILNALDARPSEYYSMWILSVFQGLPCVGILALPYSNAPRYCQIRKRRATILRPRVCN